MSFQSYKDESRKNWGSSAPGAISEERIKLGAILRIADAVELMAKNHQQLIDERDRYQKIYHEAVARESKRVRTIAGLRGYIKRLKNK